MFFFSPNVAWEIAESPTFSEFANKVSTATFSSVPEWCRTPQYSRPWRSVAPSSCGSLPDRYITRGSAGKFNTRFNNRVVHTCNPSC